MKSNQINKRFTDIRIRTEKLLLKSIATLRKWEKGLNIILYYKGSIELMIKEFFNKLCWDNWTTIWCNFLVYFTTCTQINPYGLKTQMWKIYFYFTLHFYHLSTFLSWTHINSWNNYLYNCNYSFIMMFDSMKKISCLSPKYSHIAFNWRPCYTKSSSYLGINRLSFFT